MKLYGTITSERATKGQGGNKYLNIDILVGDKNNPILLAQFTAEHKSDVDGMGSGYVLYDHNSRENIYWVLDKEKGERQKGEMSEPRQDYHCKICKDSDEWGNCRVCGRHK
jgi:hypothetical protein